MPEEALDPILIQVTVPLPISMIFAGWTESEKVSEWLCDSAKVEPKMGGAYELTWTKEFQATSPGRVTHLTPDVDVGFTWYGPEPYGRTMNHPSPKTNVYVRLQQSPEGIDVTLEHAGWGSGEAWEEARSWHFHFWDDRMGRLKDFLIRAAYG